MTAPASPELSETVPIDAAHQSSQLKAVGKKVPVLSLQSA